VPATVNTAYAAPCPPVLWQDKQFLPALWLVPGGVRQLTLLCVLLAALLDSLLALLTEELLDSLLALLTEELLDSLLALLTEELLDSLLALDSTEVAELSLLLIAVSAPLGTELAIFTTLLAA